VPTLDVIGLLAPVAPEQPCGRNHDETFEFHALEQAASEPQEPGLKNVVSVDTRDWRDVATKAQRLLQQSKDVRLAVLLARALLQVDGIPGLCAGVGLVKGLLDSYWDQLYPSLEDDGSEPIMRLNAIRELWAPAMLSQLRITPLVSVRGLGEFSLNDVLVAKGLQKPRPGSTAASAAHVVRALEEGGSEELRLKLKLVQTDLKSIEAIVRQKAAGAYQVDAGPLNELFARMEKHLIEHIHVAAAAPAAADVAPEQVPSGATGGRSVPMIEGEVRSREDVVRMLDKICRYYEQHEPSSPVPLLMQRAKRLATMSFLEIVRDLADKGLPQVEAVTGKDGKA
jgi:type VI secretion system protein ImpA